MNVSCQTLTLPWSEEALDGCDSLLFVCLLCPTSLLPVFATCITVPSSASGMEQGSIRILKQWHTFARNYVFWHWDKKKSCPYPICLNCCWELPWSLYHSRFGMPLFQCFITLNTVFFFFFPLDIQIKCIFLQMEAFCPCAIWHSHLQLYFFYFKFYPVLLFIFLLYNPLLFKTWYIIELPFSHWLNFLNLFWLLFLHSVAELF